MHVQATNSACRLRCVHGLEPEVAVKQDQLMTPGEVQTGDSVTRNYKTGKSVGDSDHVCLCGDGRKSGLAGKGGDNFLGCWSLGALVTQVCAFVRPSECATEMCALRRMCFHIKTCKQY